MSAEGHREDKHGPPPLLKTNCPSTHHPLQCDAVFLLPLILISILQRREEGAEEMGDPGKGC